jgi:hypothetical protein
VCLTYDVREPAQDAAQIQAPIGFVRARFVSAE